MSLNTFTSGLRDTTKTDTQKYAAFATFVTYYNTLVTATLGTKTYSDVNYHNTFSKEAGNYYT